MQLNADWAGETVAWLRQRKVDLRPLLTHTFSLDNITAAYDLFGNRRDGVLKVAIRP